MTLTVTQNTTQNNLTITQSNVVVKLQPVINASAQKVETDPIFQASEASLFVAGDKANLDNQSGVNTGDETTLSIQTKRPLKTVNGKSLEGSGNIVVGSSVTKTSDLTNDGSDATSTYVEADELGAVAFSNDYNDLDNKPPTFPPSSHTHVEADITDLDKYTQSETNNLLGNKLDKVSTAGVERAYIVNADGSQGTKATSEFKDVLEFANLAAFPATGESGKIYVALDTNFTYRWSGSVYVQIGGSIKSRITNTSVSGNYVLNHSLASDWKLTLTGATTLSEINLPTGGDTIEFTLKIFGNFALTVPAYWTVTGDSYSTPLWNFYAIQIHKGDSPQEATAFLTNL